jgi:aspartate racemase
MTRILGIVGGLGPESTIDYYRMIIARYRERAAHASPAIVIASLDVDRAIAMLNASKLEELADYLSTGVAQVARAGAAFGLIAANTPHIVFDAVARRSPIPLLSIVEATRDRARSLGLRRPALIGTRFTMSSGFYEKAFKPSDIDLIVPDAAEQETIHEKYINELLEGTFLPETRHLIASIIETLRRRHAVDAVILAGTELPLLLRGTDLGLPVLDTTVIHVEAAVERLLA